MGTSEEVKSFEGPSNIHGLRMILCTPLNILLLSVPMGFASAYLHWDAQLTFWLNFFALVPLAKVLGDATEELDAAINNAMVSGLLNATFGNAVEMIVSVQALRIGNIMVV